VTDKTSPVSFLQDELPSDSRHSRQIARRQMIAEAVMAEGSMRIEDLTERFGISLMTAHRDVDELVSRGLFRKTRGIVSAAATSLIESSDVYRANRQAGEKKMIAAAAMQFIEPGQALFFADSTTRLHMASQLPPLMNALKDMHDVTLLALGGQYYNWCNAFMGRMTINEINRLRADVAFISMSAIIDDVVFHQSPEIVDIKRAMFDSAAKSILLMDHTKFERRALHSFAHLSEFDVVIVDEKTPAAHLERMRSKNINVVVAKGDRERT